ncbi:MAG: DNA-directed DNA polymerase II small subunit [Methanobrevibacter sp.]|nr:DNA-directed DNA polymerase II small subunit [Methanobrevibacter sp.]
MTAETLLKFARKGIILTPGAYDLIQSSKNPLDLSSSIILKLKSGKYSNEDLVPVDEKQIKDMMKELGIKIVEKKEISHDSLDDFSGVNKVERKETVEKTSEETKPAIETKPQTTIENKAKGTTKPLEEKPQTQKTETQERGMERTKPLEEKPQEQINKPSAAVEKTIEKPKALKTDKTGYPSEHIVKIDDVQVSEETKQKYRRNLTESKVSFDKFKVLKDTSNKSYTSGDIGNLIEYFQNRYKKLSDILSKRPELRTWQKINEITDNQTDLSLIVMITDIKSTKNGHYFIEVEDDTGSMPILVSKDNEELIHAAKNLMKDEVIGVLAQKRPGNELAICQNLIDPGVPRIAKKEVDFGTVFTSDIHIGSSTFLEDAFTKFIKWINGDFGNEEQMEMANNVKYMIIGGDIVDGIGVYPNQDKELAIKDITAQYDEAARLVGDIRSDVKIIITPGNHDASRVAEPQPAVPEKYAKSLYQLNNVEFLSNPSMVSLDGLEVLIYHGRGIDDMVMGSNDFSHERNDLVMREFLNKRHLAPLYGERTPLASELEDHLVIDRVPDVLHTGHVHINTYANHNGIHCINSGTFQTQTEFQKIYNIVPTPAEVPIIDVGGNYKQLKFID